MGVNFDNSGSVATKAWILDRFERVGDTDGDEQLLRHGDVNADRGAR
jgi:hypothetical protein